MTEVAGRGYVVKFTVSFTPTSNIVSPPFTSKASRTLVINALKRVCGADGVKHLLVRGGLKPTLISPLFTVKRDARSYLYKLEDGRQLQPITLREGFVYGFNVTYLASLKLDILIDALSPGVELPLFTGNVHIRDLSIEAKRLESMNLDGRYIRMSFKTPVLLSFPKSWIKAPTPLRHSLFPIPCLVTWSLARHWNRYAPEEVRISNVKRLAAYSNYALVETNHRIKPVTAVYDGRRRPRGFIGWVIYEHRKLKPKLSRRISQLMEYANYVGVGRSRAIGFGITEVKAIHNHHQPPS